MGENHCTRPYLIYGNERKDKADQRTEGPVEENVKISRAQPIPNFYQISH